MSREELEKLTAIKLRELAKQYEEIKGAHAMKKEDLILAILKARGETVKKAKKSVPKISGLKKQIRSLKAEKGEALVEKDRRKVAQMRKQIKKLKRLTRQLAMEKIK